MDPVCLFPEEMRGEVEVFQMVEQLKRRIPIGSRRQWGNNIFYSKRIGI